MCLPAGERGLHEHVVESTHIGASGLAPDLFGVGLVSSACLTMKACVTGVTGFIGGALAESLAATGWEVCALVRPGGRARLAALAQYQIFEADLARGDAAQLRAALTGCNVVFHAAAIRNRWGTLPEAYRAVNVEGTLQLLNTARGLAQRFVYVSSVGVMGYPGVSGIDETFPVAPQAGPVGYHSTKAEAERRVLAQAGELEVVVVRPTITYGPGDQDGMVTRLADMLARRRFVSIGAGDNQVHLTFIDDLIHGLVLAGTRPVAGRIFILAGPAAIAMRSLIALVASQVGVPAPRLSLPEGVARAVGHGAEQVWRLGRLPGAPPITLDKVDVLCRHRSFSWAAAARDLGYRPEIGYELGLARTLAWMAAFPGRWPWARRPAR
jgi:nucleoside-diphosphate-sugar epimerase